MIALDAIVRPSTTATIAAPVSVPRADRAAIVASGEVRTLLSLNGAAVLLFGILPGGLMALCAQAIVRALAT